MQGNAFYNSRFITINNKLAFQIQKRIQTGTDCPDQLWKYSIGQSYVEWKNSFVNA